MQEEGRRHHHTGVDVDPKLPLPVGCQRSLTTIWPCWVHLRLAGASELPAQVTLALTARTSGQRRARPTPLSRSRWPARAGAAGLEESAADGRERSPPGTSPDPCSWRTRISDTPAPPQEDRQDRTRPGPTTHDETMAATRWPRPYPARAAGTSRGPACLPRGWESTVACQSISELFDRSPALRQGSPGVTRLRGAGLTFHGQG